MKRSQYNIKIPTSSGSYVYNTVTGCFLPGDDAAGLSCAPFSVEDDCNEYSELVSRNEELRRNSDFLVVTVQLTLSCNLRCVYCFQDRVVADIPDAAIQSILAWFRVSMSERPWTRRLVVFWFGGEPTLRIEQMIAYSAALRNVCQEYEVAYSSRLITNGYNLDAVLPFVENLSLTDIQVTLDGSLAIHDARRPRVDGMGSYRQILGGFERIHSTIDLVVRCNIDRSNFHDAALLLADIRSLRLDGSVRMFVQPMLVEDYGGESTCYVDRLDTLDRDTMNQLLILEGECRSLEPPRFIGSVCNVDFPGSLVVDVNGNCGKCWAKAGLGGSDFVHDALDTALRVTPRYEPRRSECRTCFAFPVCMGGCIFRPRDSAACRASRFRVFSTARYCIEKESAGAVNGVA